MVGKTLKDVLFNGFGTKPDLSQILEIELPGLGLTSIVVNKTSKRKSLAIHIKEGGVEVRAPHRISDSQIISFLKTKSGWILKKINAQNLRPKFEPKTFLSGDRFFLLGKCFELIVQEGGKKSIELEDQKIQLQLGNRKQLREPVIRTERQLKTWFIEYAETHISERVNHFCEIMGEHVKSIKIRNFKSQWGSCSIDADLKFNWRLIMAPREVIDYVVVHELSHIKHHNHSRRFWARVENFMPDYKNHKKWLNENSALLRWD